MKRVVLLLLIATTALAAPEKWYENYKRGVAAVNSKQYKAGADALQAAIAEKPAEGTGVRAGNQLVTYTPHFFLGIAKFNLGDVDGALREWRTSEEQGAIAKTEYYANLKDWVARAQTEKQRTALSAAAGPKKAADTAISRALALQVDALSAGGDRTESYRNAQRKLQEAMGQFQKAGSDIEAYKTAEATATQATSLFTAAAEEAKKVKAAQAARPPVVKPTPPVQQKIIAPALPPPAPVKTEAQVAAELAVQQYSRDVSEAGSGAKPEVQAFLREESRETDELRKQLAAAKTDPEFQQITMAVSNRKTAMTNRIAELNAPPPPPVVIASNPITAQPRNPEQDLRAAYRAFAAGDLASSEQILTRLLKERPIGEAYLLRGCARYTRAMLARTPDPLLVAATADFKAALSQNRALRLDPNAFSPKLVRFFEQVKNGNSN